MKPWLPLNKDFLAMAEKEIILRHKPALEDLFTRYNHREFVHPDPLEFLYNYEKSEDREVVGLIASSLAYGRVFQILKSVEAVLNRIGSPCDFVKTTPERTIFEIFRGFKYRFTTGQEMAALIIGVKRALETYGTLVACFEAGFKGEDNSIFPALCHFVHVVSNNDPGQVKSLLPDPKRGSACKRLNLYLRWMVRKDDVDPGGWDNIPASALIVPLDTHMHRISLILGLTERKQSDMRTALEITQAFQTIEPDDPVRYDFCLTRLGIRSDTAPHKFFHFTATE